MFSNKVKKFFLWVILIVLPAGTAKTDTVFNIEVRTVLASQEDSFHDPQLADLIKELQSVFRYTSYRLLSLDRMSLRTGETGAVNLPGNRILKISPQGIRGDRAEQNLVIFKESQSIFRTTIRLRNHGSITVGGPRHKNGYLLFNISNSF